MSTLPRHALSVRQPWAWAILHAGKDIENRSWRYGHPSRRFRGAVCIHAARGMTRAEYEEAAGFMAKIGVVCPKPADLVRGAILGTVVIVDGINVNNPPAASPWFMGPFGFVLRDAQPLTAPIPAMGQLDFFQWSQGGEIISPSKWMLKTSEEAML